MKKLEHVVYSGLEKVPEASRNHVDELVKRLQEYVGKKGVVGVTAGVSDLKLYAVVRIKREANTEEIFHGLDESDKALIGFLVCAPAGIPSASAYNRRR